MNDFTLDPTKDFTPRQGEKRQPSLVSEDLPDLSRLDDMSREELIALVRRLLCQCGTVAMMTEYEIIEAMKLKLAINGLTEADAYKALPSMKEYLDRVVGKPAGSAATINIGGNPVGNEPMAIQVTFVKSSDYKTIEHDS